jgi:hypothetical protein
MDGSIRLEQLEKQVQKLLATEPRLRRMEWLCALLLILNVFLAWSWLASGGSSTCVVAGQASADTGNVQVSIINASQEGAGAKSVSIQTNQVSNSTFVATGGSTISAK